MVWRGATYNERFILVLNRSDLNAGMSMFVRSWMMDSLESRMYLYLKILDDDCVNLLIGLPR